MGRKAGTKMIETIAIKESAGLEKSSPRYADRIYEHILEQIVAGEFKIGERLPSESQLGAHYAVSRAVVREALVRLHADGVAVTRRGAGTYVQRQPGREFLRLAPIGGVADLMRWFGVCIALAGGGAEPGAPA